MATGECSVGISILNADVNINEFRKIENFWLCLELLTISSRSKRHLRLKRKLFSDSTLLQTVYATIAEIYSVCVLFLIKVSKTGWRKSVKSNFISTRVDEAD